MKLLLEHSEQTASSFHLRWEFYLHITKRSCKYSVVESCRSKLLSPLRCIAIRKWLQTSKNSLLGSDKLLGQTSPA